MIKLSSYVGLKKEYLKLFSIHLGSLHRVLLNHFYGTRAMYDVVIIRAIFV